MESSKLTSLIEESSDSDKNNEWALKELDSRGSCMQLGSGTQCVNEVNSILNSLKQQLLTWRDKEERRLLQKFEKLCAQSVPLEKTVHLQPFKSDPLQSRPVGVAMHEPVDISPSLPLHPLTVKGTKTGTLKYDESAVRPGTIGSNSDSSAESFDWSIVNDVIVRSLDLVNRLDEDRRVTIEMWKEVKEKVDKMRAILADKAAERLRLLPLLVQQEHEQCLRDIIELKWHVSFEGRQLERIEDDVKIVVDTNTHLKEEVQETKDQISLLHEKLQLEGSKLNAIVRQQIEVDAELHKRREYMERALLKSEKTQVKVESEKRRMKKKIEELNAHLVSTNDQLISAMKEQDSLNYKIAITQATINDNKSHKERLENEVAGYKQQISQTETRVAMLQDTIRDLEKKHNNADIVLNFLKKKKRESYNKLEKENDALLAIIEEKTASHRKSRLSNEHLLHEIEEMQQKIIEFKAKCADDTKSIERAKKELTKIDEQLQVIHAKTEAIRQEHHELEQVFKDEEARLGSIEQDLRRSLQGLKDDHQKETRIKVTHEGKIKINSKRLDKLKMDNRDAEKEAKRLAEAAVEKHRAQCEMVSDLEQERKQKSMKEAELRQAIDSTMRELATIEQELGGKYSSLTSQELSLSGQVKEKGNEARHIKEQMELYSDRVGDLIKSMASVEKMEQDFIASIGILESNKEELTDNIAAERNEVESWQEALKNFVEFAREANEKFSKYLIERQEYSNELETRTHEALVQNRKLMEDYEQLRETHVGIKTDYLGAVERKLKLELAYKDKKELMALQTKLSTTMKSYYEHRGAQASHKLNNFSSSISNAYKDIGSIHEQLDVSVNNIGQFLQSAVNSQRMIVTQHRVPSDNTDHVSDTSCTNVPKDTTLSDKAITNCCKTVTFAPQPIHCT